MNLPVWAQVAPVVGMLLVMSAFATAALRNNNTVTNELENRDATRRKEIADLQRDNRRCEHRLSIVIAACNKAGVTIPPEVWDAV